MMGNILKNTIALSISLFIASPLLISFDVVINGYFNPELGVWSQSFINGYFALGLSVILFPLTIITPMVTHECLINRFSSQSKSSKKQHSGNLIGKKIVDNKVLNIMATCFLDIGIFRKIVAYFKEIIDNPWVLLSDIMLLIVIGCGLGVAWAFFSIFYALGGGTGADLISPNSW
ncbi:hypothetical protein BZG84_16120 [Salinivibrio sp. PR932]|nr:hypothetical protein BZG84_16120 [Salinivibrio sp. PR932]